MDKIIWEDKHLKKYLLIGSCLIFISICLAFAENRPDFMMRSIIALLFPIPLLIIVLRARLTYITKQGIRIGNAKTGDYNALKLSKPKLILWGDINTIRIQMKSVDYPLSKNMEAFLLIITKGGQKYESFIAQPTQFVEAIKKLNHGKLLGPVNSKFDPKESVENTEKLNNVPKPTQRWTIFTIIWIVFFLVSGLIWRFKYGVLNNQMQLIWRSIMIIPPIIYALILKLKYK
jgi:hypothetical protein